ncbi:Gfo/Idh/MocA family protein [Rhabdaerophilum calidifontis]|uniref:Gfo/Idh/MocA family protein n=1 Tax=Rhabdaerophilum calidifontis TaxID=2604328 RepID=UPI00123A9CC8|nr:Gfo/Idh/MocA family oxidoreductase [Rhabdaerophilum calidifontis]
MTIRAGVIGLGIGEQHAAFLDSAPGCALVAVCDRDEARLAATGARFPAAARYADARAMLDGAALDLVVVASYDADHAAQILDAIARGCHVFAEKPLATREEDTAAIAAALAARPGIRLSSNTILRRSPRFLALKAEIGRGAFGRLTAIEGDYNYGRLHKLTEGWRGRDPGYSVILGGGIHLADLLLWLVASPAREVFALSNAIASQGTAFAGQDLAMALVRFENGVIGKIGANFGCVEPHFHRLLVYGTEATFENGRDHARIWRSRDPAVAPERVETAYPGVPKHALLACFVSSLLGQGDAAIRAEEVFAAMNLCHAIDRSARSGRPEPVLPSISFSA